jgi:riboflavin transporter FmnP
MPWDHYLKVVCLHILNDELTVDLVIVPALACLLLEHDITCGTHVLFVKLYAWYAKDPSSYPMKIMGLLLSLSF